MTKREIHTYDSDEDAIKKVSSFEKDWNYDLLAHTAMHKTGLKLAIEIDGDEQIVVSSENASDWAHHMIFHEKFTKREVLTYRNALLQEFLALYHHNLDKEKVISEMFPYMYAQSLSNKYHS